VVFKTLFIHRFRIVSPILYVVMGWLIVVAIKPAMSLIPAGGLELLLAGGLFYTGGLVFYGIDKIPYHHALWHLFVVAGSLCHFLAVILHVIPS
jgi:hemolysin III